MKRCACMIVLFLCICICLSAALNAHAETVRRKKVISIVLDDSGSMDNGSGTRWDNANYAIQTLLGTLNPDDEARLYYLNHNTRRGKATATEVDLSAGGIQRELSTISLVNSSGGTEFAIVKQAIEELNKRTPAENEEYWLLVISDGEFNDMRNQSEVRDAFLSYTSNGISSEHIPLRIVYCSIGNSNLRLDRTGMSSGELANRNVYTYHADNTSQIVDAIDSIAERLSGRTRVKDSKIKRLANDTVEVSSDVPLFNIVVLNQGAARLKSVRTGSGNALFISREAIARAPQNTNLSSGVFTVTNSKQNIPAGQYILSFDSAVDVNRLMVLFEPALEIRLTQLLNGQMVDSSILHTKAHVNDLYGAVSEIYETGTNNRVGLRSLPSGSRFEFEIRNNGSKVYSDSGDVPGVSNWTLPSGNIIIQATLSIPGYNDITFIDSFTPSPELIYTAQIVKRKGLSGDTLTATTEECKRAEACLDFNIYANGTRLTNDADVKALGLKLSCDLPDAVLEYPGKGVVRFTAAKADPEKYLGDHPLDLILTSKGKSLYKAILHIDLSTFEVDVTPRKGISITEAAFRDKPQDFTFRLLVDGKAASARDYGVSIRTDLPSWTVDWDKNGNLLLKTDYKAGMQARTYPIAAVLNGAELDEKASFTMTESVYAIGLKPASGRVKQSEFENTPLSFEITLKEDKKAIDPGLLSLSTSKDGLELEYAADAKNKNTYILTVKGNIATDAGEYIITLKMTAGTGTETILELPVTVEPAVWSIVHEPANQLIFHTLHQLDTNSTAINFAITADGRPLSDAEFGILTQKGIVSCSKSNADDPCTLNTAQSGYTAMPTGLVGKLPSTDTAIYSITCRAADAVDTVEYHYQHIDYSVSASPATAQEIVSTDMRYNDKSLRFTVRGNGTPLGRDIVSGNYQLELKNAYRRFVKLEHQVKADGTIVVTPVAKTQSWLFAYIPLLLPKGAMDVTLTFSGEQGQGQFNVVTAGIIPEWKPYVISLAIFTYVMIISFKKRFAHKAYIHYAEGRVDGPFLTFNNGWSHKKLCRPSIFRYLLNLLAPVKREHSHMLGASMRAVEWGLSRFRGDAIEVYSSKSTRIRPVRSRRLDLDSEVFSLDYPQGGSSDAHWVEIGDQNGFVIINGTSATVFKYTSKRQ